MNYSIISERFVKCLEFLKEHKIVPSNRQFAIRLNYHPQSLNDILKRKRNVTVDLLKSAVEEFNMSPRFLYLGEGEMFNSSVNDQSIEEQNQSNGIPHVTDSIFSKYSVHAEDDLFVDKLPKISVPGILNTERYRCFDVSCDSMEPTLFHGDRVVCKRIDKEDWSHAIRDNFVYVLVSNSDILIRRVSNRIKDQNLLVLNSDNAYFGSTDFNVDQLQEAWRVSMKISPFVPSPSNQRNNFHSDIDNMKDTINQQSTIIKTLNSTIEKLLKQNRSRI